MSGLRRASMACRWFVHGCIQTQSNGAGSNRHDLDRSIPALPGCNILNRLMEDGTWCKRASVFDRVKKMLREVTLVRRPAFVPAAGPDPSSHGDSSTDKGQKADDRDGKQGLHGLTEEYQGAKTSCRLIDFRRSFAGILPPTDQFRQALGAGFSRCFALVYSSYIGVRTRYALAVLVFST